MGGLSLCLSLLGARWYCRSPGWRRQDWRAPRATGWDLTRGCLAPTTAGFRSLRVWTRGGQSGTRFGARGDCVFLRWSRRADVAGEEQRHAVAEQRRAACHNYGTFALNTSCFIRRVRYVRLLAALPRLCVCTVVSRSTSARPASVRGQEIRKIKNSKKKYPGPRRPPRDNV